MYRLERNLLL